MSAGNPLSRIGAYFPPLPETIPVTSSVTGEILAAICTICDAQLPAEYAGRGHCDPRYPPARPRPRRSFLRSITNLRAPTRQEIRENEREEWRP